MEILIALSVFATVTALMAAFLGRDANPVHRRLEMYKGLTVAEDAPEKPPTFAERVLRPVLETFIRSFRTVLPSTTLDKLEHRLVLAGDPVNLTGLLVIWSVCALGLPVLMFFLLAAKGPLGSSQLLLLAGISGMGGYLPHLWLKNKTEKRQRTIMKSLPDAIDLLVTSVEAGLGMDAGLAQVAEKVGGPIASELRRMLREMAMGQARKDALTALADRTAVPDVKLFVNALVQAEAMGVGLAQVIRVQADQMRVRRRQRAEEQAHKAPVKITIPLVLFIFPTILVVILGPAAIQMKSLFANP